MESRNCSFIRNFAVQAQMSPIAEIRLSLRLGSFCKCVSGAKKDFYSAFRTPRIMAF
jgi:hypothetical protein